MFRKARRFNLALQGGGAHGAFTWGVLDRLTEEDGIGFDTISATSAGAVNAVALLAGWQEGGPAGARAKLAALWKAIHAASVPDLLRLNPLLHSLFNLEGLARSTLARLTTVLSPYDLNPLDLNPLRRLLEELIDFEALRAKPPARLLIAATDVATGRARLFSAGEISVEVVLASACLPTLHQAVGIDGRWYWDGGFSANPDLLRLAEVSDTRDTLVVLLNPIRAEKVPKEAGEIADRINRITFNQPFLRDVQAIYEARRRCSGMQRMLRSAGERRVASQRYHLIEAGPYTSKLSPESRLQPDMAVLTHLKSSGRTEAERWLSRWSKRHPAEADSLAGQAFQFGTATLPKNE